VCRTFSNGYGKRVRKKRTEKVYGKTLAKMSEAQLSLLQQWRDEDYCNVLKTMRKVSSNLGRELTREQADRFEAIPILFAGPPSPTMTGQVRVHFDKKEVWKVVWRFCEAHPMFFSDTVEGILNNFDLARQLG
jgi:hypothetical protein